MSRTTMTDRSYVVGDRRFRTSIKSGPNTINDTQVAGMRVFDVADLSQAHARGPGETSTCEATICGFRICDPPGRVRGTRSEKVLLWPAQLFQQESERLIGTPGRVEKAHLASSIGRNVCICRIRIEHRFRVSGCRYDEFGMKQPTVTGRTATRVANRYLNLCRELRRDLDQLRIQAEMRH
jgi:hypothetical protein